MQRAPWLLILTVSYRPHERWASLAKLVEEFEWWRIRYLHAMGFVLPYLYTATFFQSMMQVITRHPELVNAPGLCNATQLGLRPPLE